MSDTPPPVSDQTGKRPGRGGRWLLYGSLALNLLVVGVVVGAVVSGAPKGGPGRHWVTDSPFPLVRALDAEAREEFRAQLEADRPPRSARVLETVKRRRDLLRSLRAEPFDPDAFEAALSAQSEAMDARNRAGRVALANLVQGMSATERRAYADRIEQAARDRKASRSDGGKPPPQPSGG